MGAGGGPHRFGDIRPVARPTGPFRRLASRGHGPRGNRPVRTQPNLPRRAAGAGCGAGAPQASEANDALASEIEKRPSRYSGFAHLALQDPAAAGVELARSVRSGGPFCRAKGRVIGGFSSTRRASTSLSPFPSNVQGMIRTLNGFPAATPLRTLTKLPTSAPPAPVSDCAEPVKRKLSGTLFLACRTEEHRAHTGGEVFQGVVDEVLLDDSGRLRRCGRC